MLPAPRWVGYLPAPARLCLVGSLLLRRLRASAVAVVFRRGRSFRCCVWCPLATRCAPRGCIPRMQPWRADQGCNLCSTAKQIPDELTLVPQQQHSHRAVPRRDGHGPRGYGTAPARKRARALLTNGTTRDLSVTLDPSVISSRHTRTDTGANKRPPPTPTQHVVGGARGGVPAPGAVSPGRRSARRGRGPRRRRRQGGDCVGAEHAVGLRGRRPGEAGHREVAGRRGGAQGAGHLPAARGRIRGPLPQPPPLPGLLLPRPLRAGARRPGDNAHQDPPRLPAEPREAAGGEVVLPAGGGLQAQPAAPGRQGPRRLDHGSQGPVQG